jgi:hypothetical protein
MDPRVRTLRHDLRGQLNSIMLCASVLPITDDRSEKTQFLDEILRAADQAEAILDQIDQLPPESFVESPAPAP